MKQDVSQARHELILQIPDVQSMMKVKNMAKHWTGVTVIQSAVETDQLMVYGPLATLFAMVHSLGAGHNVVLYIYEVNSL